MKIRVPINYYYARVLCQEEQSLVDLSEKDEGIITFSKEKDNPRHLKVRFWPQELKKKDNPIDGKNAVDIDIYSGIVIIYKESQISQASLGSCVQYTDGRGYHYNDMAPRLDLRFPDLCGYVKEISPGYLANIHPVPCPINICTIFHKGLAKVEDYPHGKLKIHTSSYDITGYAMQLHPFLINEITSLLGDNPTDTPLLGNNPTDSTDSIDAGAPLANYRQI